MVGKPHFAEGWISGRRAEQRTVLCRDSTIYDLKGLGWSSLGRLPEKASRHFELLEKLKLSRFDCPSFGSRSPVATPLANP